MTNEVEMTSKEEADRNKMFQNTLAEYILLGPLVLILLLVKLWKFCTGAKPRS